MPKHDRIQEALEELGGLRSTNEGPQFESQLCVFLRDRSNLVVAKAAKIARERRVLAVVPDMVTTFRKLMRDPARLDKRCEALTEIAGTLYELDYTEADVYLMGLRHIQMEGSYGPPVDAAAQLRGICAQGLTRTADPSALEEVVELLADREVPARIGAVRALAANGGTAGALALRLKILTGDREPEVVSECFAGLLSGHTESSVDFVARYVDSEREEIAEAAVLALGVSRSTKAVTVLRERWKRTSRGRLKNALLLALATSRSEDALTVLLHELETGSASVAKEILTALAGQRPSASIRQMIEAAVRRCGEEVLQEQYRSLFDVQR
jgi:HEAT repeat protein